MLTARIRRRVTLSDRIVAYLSACEQPVHWRVIMRRVRYRRSELAFRSTLCRLATNGRLQWYGLGTYGIPRKAGGG